MRKLPRLKPSTLTIRKYSSDGFAGGAVERCVGRIRFDFLGCIDELFLDKSGRFIGVQSTSWGNVSARKKKMNELLAGEGRESDGIKYFVHHHDLVILGWKEPTGEGYPYRMLIYDREAGWGEIGGIWIP